MFHSFGMQENRTYHSHSLFHNFVSRFIWISWISKTLIHCGFIVNIFFSLVIPKANPVLQEYGAYHLIYFYSKCTFSPMLVPWLYPVLFCILNLLLFIDIFHSVFTHKWFSAYLQSILNFFLLLCTFLWSSLHLFLKFVIYFYYLCLLNIHYLPGICNSVFIVYKLTNDTFLSDYVTSP